MTATVSAFDDELVGRIDNDDSEPGGRSAALVSAEEPCANRCGRCDDCTLAAVVIEVQVPVPRAPNGVVQYLAARFTATSARQMAGHLLAAADMVGDVQ